jgi:hypothetical protein
MTLIALKIGEQMLKVFILGLEDLHSVVGNFSFEDEKYLYLDDAGKKIKIPHKRIAYIEDWAEVGTVSTQGGSTPFLTSKSTIAQELPRNESLTPQQIKNALSEVGPQDATKIGAQLQAMLSQRLADQQKEAMRASQVEPEDVPDPASTVQLSGQQVELLLLFTGAKEGQYPLKVPVEMFNGQYTPALGREIFKIPDIQAFMSSDIILDGLPVVKGTTINFKVKQAKTVGDILAKTDVLGKMLSVGNSPLLNKQARKSPFESGFSMPASPFEKIPTILGKPNDETEE